MSSIATIAVGSMNPVKLGAVRNIAQHVWPSVLVLPVQVDTGVSVMPMTEAEGIAGALHRATEALRLTECDLGMGLEGAVQDTPHGMLLSNWVAIIDREGHSGIANGGCLPLPECIARELRDGAELGPLIDRYSGVTNSKQHLGAAGYLTKDLVPRESAFGVAVAFALAPFLRPELYAAET